MGLEETFDAGWFLLIAPPLVVMLILAILLRKRAELRQFEQTQHELRDARQRGSHQARLQHPVIDLGQCIGCGACVRACPEDGVLSLLHGQAVVVHGARCVGHGLCADACPTSTIAITLGDLSDRDDLPALQSDFEAVNVPGLFLAGEVGGFALVRTANNQGVAVADAVARKIKTAAPPPASDIDGPLDLLIVGAGPGGMACALRARELGLNIRIIDQADRLGGTVAAYPRRKMVMTQPVTLPLHGRLKRMSYQKEELVELWEELAAKHDLPIQLNTQFTGLEREGEDRFSVRTNRGPIAARTVCLALGRRGAPRKLGVPGERLPKVAYSLLDAASYRDRRILVVGGGDSAVEAALGLADQPGNDVTLSYRKKEFSRIKARNETRLKRAREAQRLRVICESDVVGITDDEVQLSIAGDGGVQQRTLPNDEVFIFAGGDPPFDLLKRAGVSFDLSDRPPADELTTQSRGLLVALLLTVLLSLSLGAWAFMFRDYFGLDPHLRASSVHHSWLRPAGPIGLTAGVLGCALILFNLLYLARRSSKWCNWLPGRLSVWMDSHICTGLGAFFCILAHAGFAVRTTVGGHAFLALSIVVVTGGIGRYLYAFVPRAANGSEMDLDRLRQQLVQVSGQWDRQERGFGTSVRAQIELLTATDRWRPGLINRLLMLLVGQLQLRRTLNHLRSEGRHEGIPEHEVRRVLALARRAYRLSLIVIHFEEIRAVLSSWRYFHRWLALLMVLLAIVHIAAAVRYAHFDWPDWPFASGGRS